MPTSTNARPADHLDLLEPCELVARWAVGSRRARCRRAARNARAAGERAPGRWTRAIVRRSAGWVRRTTAPSPSADRASAAGRNEVPAPASTSGTSASRCVGLHRHGRREPGRRPRPRRRPSRSDAPGGLSTSGCALERAQREAPGAGGRPWRRHGEELLDDERVLPQVPVGRALLGDADLGRTGADGGGHLLRVVRARPGAPAPRGGRGGTPRRGRPPGRPPSWAGRRRRAGPPPARSPPPRRRRRCRRRAAPGGPAARGPRPPG